MTTERNIPDNAVRGRLAETYARLTPSARPLFLKRIKSIPAYASYADELDPPKAVTAENTNWMSKALDNPVAKTFMAPFNWMNENIEQPFGAIVTSPFTKASETPRQEGESWLEWEKRQYNEQVPMLGKMAVETVPWLIPSLLSGGIGMVARGASAASKIAKVATTTQKVAQAVTSLGKVSRFDEAGKLIKAGTGLAGILGDAGKAGSTASKIGRGVGKTLQYSPWGLTEQLGEAVVGGAINKIAKLGKTTPIKTLGAALDWDDAITLPSDELLNNMYKQGNFTDFARWAETKPFLGKVVKAVVGEKGFVDAASKKPIDAVRRAMVNMYTLQERGSNVVRNTMPRLRVYGDIKKLTKMADDGLVPSAKPLTPELSEKVLSPEGRQHYLFSEAVINTSPDDVYKYTRIKQREVASEAMEEAKVLNLKNVRSEVKRLSSLNMLDTEEARRIESLADFLEDYSAMGSEWVEDRLIFDVADDLSKYVEEHMNNLRTRVSSGDRLYHESVKLADDLESYLKLLKSSTRKDKAIGIDSVVGRAHRQEASALAQIFGVRKSVASNIGLDVNTDLKRYMDSMQSGAIKVKTLANRLGVADAELDEMDKLVKTLTPQDYAEIHIYGKGDPNGGGCTFVFKSGKWVNMAKTDYHSVSMFPNDYGKANPTHSSMRTPRREVDKIKVNQFITDHYNVLASGKYGIGLWWDKPAKETVVDLVALTRNKADAVNLGLMRGQDAIYYLRDMSEVSLKGLEPKAPLSQYIYDILEHPENYKFETESQKAFFTEVIKIKKELNDLLVAEGLKPSGRYHRMVDGIKMADGTYNKSIYGSDQSLRRTYQTQYDSVLAHRVRGQEIVYNNNVLDIVQGDIDDTMRRIARERFVKSVKPLGKTAAAKYAELYPAEAESIEVLDRVINAGKTTRKTIQNIITAKGRTISGSTMAKIRRELPEIAAEFDKIYTMRPDSFDTVVAAMAKTLRNNTSIIHGEYGNRLTNLMKQLNLKTTSTVRQVTKKLEANPEEIKKYVRILSEINEGWRNKLDIKPEDIATAIKSFNKDSEVLRKGLISRLQNLQSVSVADMEKMLKDMAFDERTIDRLTIEAYRTIQKTSKESFETFLTDVRDKTIKLVNDAKAKKAPLAKQRLDLLQQYSGKESLQTSELVYKRIPAFKGVFFPAEVTQYMEKNYAQAGNEWIRMLGQAGGVSRSMTAVMDDSAPFVQGLYVMARNPKAWAVATANQFRMMVKPEYLDNYMVANQALHNTMAANGVPIAVTELFEGLGLAEKLAGKVPYIGNAAKGIMKQSYGRAEAAYKGFLQVARDEMWKSMVKPDMNPADIQEIGRVVSLLTGDLSTKAMGISATQRDFENAFMFFSPRFTRASLAVVGDVFRGGIAGSEARKTVAGLMAGGTAIYMGICTLTGQEPELDPTTGKFMTIEVDDTRVGLGGMVYSLARLAGNLASVDNPADLLKLDRFDNPFIKFIYGKSAPLTGLLVGAIEQTDYLGEPFESPADWAQFMASKFIPFTAQPLLDKEETSPTEMTTQFFGARSFPESAYDQREEVRDEVALSQYGAKYKSLPRSKRMKIDEAPEIAKLTEKLKDRGRETPENLAWENWNVMGEQVEDSYRKEIELASQEFRKIKDGTTFRDRVQNAKMVRRNAYAMRSKLPEYETINAYFNTPKTQGQIDSMNPLDIASDEYYRTMFADDMYDQYGNYDFNKAEERESQFVMKYGQEALNEIENVSLSRWGGTPEYQALLASQKVLEPYWKLNNHVWDSQPDIKALWENSPELQEAYLIWQGLLNQDAVKARKFLLSQRQAVILVQYAKRLALMKQQYKQQYPDAAEALKLFY